MSFQFHVEKAPPLVEKVLHFEKGCFLMLKGTALC